MIKKIIENYIKISLYNYNYMSCYIIEEEDEQPVLYDYKNDIEYNIDYINDYQKSKLHKKRIDNMLTELLETWELVIEQLEFMKKEAKLNVQQTNEFMYSIYKLFFINNKSLNNYYSIKNRKLRNKILYKKNKIDRLRYTINKL